MSKVSTKDYIALSSCVYDHGIIPQGFDIIEYCEEAGFYGAAFAWLDTNEIVIAFRGTQITDIYDILADISVLFQRAVFQTRYAYSLYKDIKKKYPKATISLTGHSLGGALAQLVAVLIARDEGIGIHTETFNAPGVSKIALESWGNFEEFKDFDITNYYNSCDVIAKRGKHIGAELPLVPEDLYKRNGNPPEYLIKITDEPGSHFISFFEEYYEVDKNSFSKKEGTIDRVIDIVSYVEVWPYSQVSDETVPVFNMDGIEVFSNKINGTYPEKSDDSYVNDEYPLIRVEKSLGTNSLANELQLQDNKFTFKQKLFYENYDEKFIRLSKDLNTISKDMYSQSDSLMLQMSKNLLDSFSNKGQDDEVASNTVVFPKTNGMSNSVFVPQFQSKNKSSQVSLQSGVTAKAATVNIVNNLGVTLSAVSNTRWNGKQHVVDVELSA